LVTGPLYHAAPLGWSMACGRIGASLIVMERFDAEGLLQVAEQYKVTHIHCVPTMFVRLLRLPESIRVKYDLSSLKYVIHAAAPCPVPVKDQMIQWLGPIIHEYYSASEGTGMTVIDSTEWLAHRGSVGRPYECEVHVLGEDGIECAPNEIGQIYFSASGTFEYYKKPDATRASFNERGWNTVGDIGYQDEDSYLYLTDRKDFVIISGGVNIYPQEVENVLLEHPLIADVAVIAKLDEEFGERVMAIVQPESGVVGSPELAQEIITFTKQRLAGFKCPSIVVFDQSLPRGENGKLYKAQLKATYQ
jgi:long-chain acyl-CoA synthetase